MKFVFRAYRPEDCRAMAELFYETVHSVNLQDYTEEQADAWADGRTDLEVWNQSFLAHKTCVAEYEGLLTGFGDMDETGYLDRLYVHKDFQGQGIGAEICRRLESQVAAERYVTYASITARPFFERMGYHMVKENQVERKGICLKNYRMEKEKKIGDCLL